MKNCLFVFLSFLETMRPLIPDFIHKQYWANRFKGQFSAVAMFVDLSGFTSLTEALMQYHRDGAETLTDILNNVFNPVVAQIRIKAFFPFEGEAL